MNALTKKSAHLDQFAAQHLPDRSTWPDLLLSLPHLQYPEQLNCVSALLDQHCEQGLGNKVALYSESETWTYFELQQKVDQIAHVLVSDMGLVTGNRVLLRGTNTLMMAACILAVFKAGCIAVITMPLLRAQELQLMINKAQIQAALCAENLLDALHIAQEKCNSLPSNKIVSFGAKNRAHSENDAKHHYKNLDNLMQSHHVPFAKVETRSDDVCLISFTSGTTGIPKASMHFHRDLLAICDCFPRSILQTSVDDIFIGSSPIAFTFGLGGSLLFPLRIGASAVLLEHATPEILLNAIAQYRATICFSVPTLYRKMLSLLSDTKHKTTVKDKSQSKLASLQKSVSAGEYLSVNTREQWQNATGLQMIDGLGTTELLHIVISAQGSDIRAGTTGKVIDGYQACVLNLTSDSDDYGKPCPPNVVGALAVKGPTGCRYLNDDRQNQYVVNGWNITGDAYSVDEDGYFYYHDRLDDMIISSGYNIASREIEDVLLKHPAVEECAVVGVADEERGNIVKAFIVLNQTYQTDDKGSDVLVKTLQDYVRQQIAPYKYPRSIEFIGHLPRTENGKLQRYKLKSTKI